MIVIPRGLARSFRAVARNCRSDRGGPLPPVIVQVEDGGLTLDCSLGEVSIAVKVAAETESNERVLVPMSVFDAVEGAAVELHLNGGKGTARWSGRDGVKSLVFDIESCESIVPPARKALELHAVEPRILTALDECRRIAGHDGGRYAFHRLEVHGKAGTLSATDGKRALIHRGIAWPFTETLLIPACRVFGVPEIANQHDVRVGRTQTHFVLAMGPWTISLAIDTTGRFPDVASVVPRSRSVTRVELDADAAADLMGHLRKWPETGEPPEAVTLDTTDGVIVRASSVDSGPLRELRLRTTTRDGPPVRVAVDREHLACALMLDCLRLRMIPGKPFVAEGTSRTFLAITLDDPILASTSMPSTLSLLPPSLLRSPDLMKSESNRRSLSVSAEPVPPPLDPFVEAEAFCVALSEAATRLTRLLQCLKSMKRPGRTLEKAFASLSAIGLAPGGEG